jgi:carbon storage regulator
MLVIRRRAGERLIIGDDVEIEILEARPNNVKLGIIAPESVPIVRKEAQLTRNTNISAAQSMNSSGIESVLAKLLQQT